MSTKLPFNLNLFTKSKSYIASKMQEFYIIDLEVCINRINMNLHNDFLYKKNHFNGRFQISAMIQIFQRMIDLLFQ